MTMTTKNLQEELNIIINQALGGGLTVAQIAAILTSESAAVTALTAAVVHDRTIQDPGATLNPSQP